MVSETSRWGFGDFGLQAADIGSGSCCSLICFNTISSVNSYRKQNPHPELRTDVTVQRALVAGETLAPAANLARQAYASTFAISNRRRC
jgi:hypothetical protein